MRTRNPQRTDPLVLLEVGLVLLLFALGTVVYWRPAGFGELHPRWWHWIVTAVLLFSIVGLGEQRRRNRGRHSLRAALNDVLREEGQ